MIGGANVSEQPTPRYGDSQSPYMSRMHAVTLQSPTPLHAAGSGKHTLSPSRGPRRYATSTSSLAHSSDAPHPIVPQTRIASTVLIRTPYQCPDTPAIAPPAAGTTNAERDRFAPPEGRVTIKYTVTPASTAPPPIAIHAGVAVL